MHRVLTDPSNKLPKPNDKSAKSAIVQPGFDEFDDQFLNTACPLFPAQQLIGSIIEGRDQER
jgi:hypothetical protein